MYHISFIRSSVHGHLGHFRVLDIINSAAVNIGVHVIFELQFHPYICPRGGLLNHIVQSLSRVHLFIIPWTAAHQASLPFIISQSWLKLMSIELMMPSNHLILCHPLLLPSIFPSIRVFSSELALCIRWPKDWSFSFSISPSSEYSGLLSFRIECLILQSKKLSRVFTNTTVQKH